MSNHDEAQSTQPTIENSTTPENEVVIAKEATISHEEVTHDAPPPEQTPPHESEEIPTTQSVETPQTTTTPPLIDEPKNSTSEANTIVYEARGMVENIDGLFNDCADVLSHDIALLEEAKARLNDQSTNHTALLLERIGFSQEGEREHSTTSSTPFVSAKYIEPVKIKDLSSGKVSGFFYGLIVAFGVLIAWLYFATEAIKVKLNMNIFSSPQTLDAIFKWIGGGLTGGEGSVTTGLLVALASMILALIVTFVIRITLKEKSNLIEAHTIKEEAKNYCTKKEACRMEMERVSTYIHDTIATLETFGVLLDEQNAKMKRILHIEKELHFDHLHHNSKEEITHANILLCGVEKLLQSPMANDNGSLSDESRYTLAQTKIDLDKYIKRFY